MTKAPTVVITRTVRLHLSPAEAAAVPNETIDCSEFHSRVLAMLIELQKERATKDEPRILRFPQ